METFTQKEQRPIDAVGVGGEEGPEKEEGGDGSQETALTVLHPPPTTNYYIVCGSFEAREPLRGS